MGTPRRLAMVIAAVGAGAACRHAVPPAAVPAPAPTPEAAASEPASGAVSVRYLVTGGGAGPALAAGQRLVAPFPIAQPLPEYPAEALAATPPPATVAVRILIDTKGRVAGIADSPLATSTPGPFAGLFRTAVERALARWEFYPAHLDTYARGEDVDGDGVADGEVLVKFAPVDVYYDLAFEFRVVEGKGAVALNTAN